MPTRILPTDNEVEQPYVGTRLELRTASTTAAVDLERRNPIVRRRHDGQPVYSPPRDGKVHSFQNR
jgi:hypothetical protein